MADDDGADWEADNRRDASSDSDDDRYRRRRSPSREVADEAKGKQGKQGKGSSASSVRDSRHSGKGQRAATNPVGRAPPWRNPNPAPAKGGPSKGLSGPCKGIRLASTPVHRKGGAVRPAFGVPVGRLVPVGKGRIPVRAPSGPAFSRYGHPYPAVYTMSVAPRPHLSAFPQARPFARIPQRSALAPPQRSALAPRPYLIPTVRRGPVGSRRPVLRPLLAPTITRAGAGRRPMILPKISPRRGAPAQAALTLARRRDVAPPRAASVNKVLKPTVKPVPRIWRGAAVQSSRASAANRVYPAGLRAPVGGLVPVEQSKAQTKMLRPTQPRRVRGSPSRHPQGHSKADCSRSRSRRSHSRSRRVRCRSRSRNRGDDRSNVGSQAPRSLKDVANMPFGHGRRDGRRSRSRSHHRTVTVAEQASAPEARGTKEARGTQEARVRPTFGKKPEVPLEEKVANLVAEAQEPVKRQSRPRSRRRSQRSPSKASRRTTTDQLEARANCLRDQLLKNFKDKKPREINSATKDRRSSRRTVSSSSSVSRDRRRRSRSRRGRRDKKPSGSAPSKR